MWLYSSEVFCTVSLHNLLKPVAGSFQGYWAILHLSFPSCKQHANNKVLSGILLCKRGDDRS